MAQAALQFVLAHPAVSCAIPGAKSPQQAEANAKAGDGTLTKEELKAVDEIVQPERSFEFKNGRHPSKPRDELGRAN